MSHPTIYFYPTIYPSIYPSPPPPLPPLSLSPSIYLGGLSIFTGCVFPFAAPHPLHKGALHGSPVREERALLTRGCGVLAEGSDEQICGLNIPTAIPLVYKLDKNFKPVKVEGAYAPLSVHPHISCLTPRPSPLNPEHGTRLPR